MKQKGSGTVSGQLRAIVGGRPESYNQIAKEAGIAPAQLSRFMSGKRGLSLASVDKLCVWLGLELRLKS